MANKKTKAKAMTFRQRLRAQSGDRLKKIESAMYGAAVRVCEEAETEINPADVMRLMTGGQTKTLRDRLIGEIANETEKELEALYNKQIDLGLQGAEDAA